MAQVLVTKENRWYQGVASLKNISEKKLELRLLKCASEVFKGYYNFQSAFVFSSKINAETAGPDLLLIAEDFSQWVIVELELIGKPLNHTKKQLRVFSKPKYNIESLVNHCTLKESRLIGKEEQLKNLFSNRDPFLLVVFDTYHKSTLSEISQDFDCKICVLEVYKTVDHDLELYRMSGDYPYIYSEFCYLKNIKSNPDMYSISRPELFSAISLGDIKVYHRNLEIEAKLFSSQEKVFLKIPQNPFDPGGDLKIFKSVGNKLILEKL